ncbi:MAG: RNA-binding S4 domain-containing protein [Pseudomonadota bacterium]
MAEKLRLDKWLWHGRFFRTRTLAANAVSGGRVRVNGNHAKKRSFTVGPGDVLTFSQGDQIRVIRIDALGEKRGPAPEAQELYTDLSPPEAKSRENAPINPRFEGKGRPTKRDRRTLDLSRERSLE